MAHQRTASRGSLGLVPPLPGSRGLLWLGKRGVLGSCLGNRSGRSVRLAGL